jgi:thiamine biosynthesis protein ThiS
MHHLRLKGEPMPEKLTVIINGCEERVPENSTILSLLELFGEHNDHLIVEHNDFFVPPHRYDSIKVNEGDVVEFINPNLGG